jgi:hypothetical protein
MPKKAAKLVVMEEVLWDMQVKPYVDFLSKLWPAYRSLLCTGVLLSLRFEEKKIKNFVNLSSVNKRSAVRQFHFFYQYATEMLGTCKKGIGFVNLHDKMLHELAGQGCYVVAYEKAESECLVYGTRPSTRGSREEGMLQVG